jgi:hypothetical protein
MGVAVKKSLKADILRQINVKKTMCVELAYL